MLIVSFQKFNCDALIVGAKFKSPRHNDISLDNHAEIKGHSKSKALMTRVTKENKVQFCLKQDLIGSATC